MRLLRLIFVIIFVCINIHAEDGVRYYDSLFENSPFLSKEWKMMQMKEGSRKSGSIEFRSYMKLEDEWLFSIYLSKEKQSFWMKLGESSHNVEVIGFDEEKKELNVNIGGVKQSIGLASSGRQSAVSKKGGDMRKMFQERKKWNKKNKERRRKK